MDSHQAKRQGRDTGASGACCENTSKIKRNTKLCCECAKRASWEIAVEQAESENRGKSIPGLRKASVMSDSKYFTTTKKGEIKELKKELDNPKENVKKEAVKKVPNSSPS